MNISTDASPATTPCCVPVSQPLSDEEAEATSRVFKALADPARVKLISLIAASGEACVCELVVPLELSQPTVSHHLKVLVDAGLLEREKRGTWAWFRLRPEALEAAGRALLG